MSYIHIYIHIYIYSRIIRYFLHMLYVSELFILIFLAVSPSFHLRQTMSYSTVSRSSSSARPQGCNLWSVTESEILLWEEFREVVGWPQEGFLGKLSLVEAALSKGNC